MRMLNFWWNLRTLFFGTSLTPAPPLVIAPPLLHARVQMVISGKRTWLVGAHAVLFVKRFKRVSSFRIMRWKGEVDCGVEKERLCIRDVIRVGVFSKLREVAKRNYFYCACRTWSGEHGTLPMDRGILPQRRITFGIAFWWMTLWHQPDKWYCCRFLVLSKKAAQ